MLILAAGVSGFAARFTATGMARAMIGLAGMQVALGLLIVTAPITAQVPDGVVRAALFNSVFALMWLIAAACFRKASNA